MREPIEIVTRGVKLPLETRRDVEARAARLDRFYERIQRCRVTVEGPGRHHLKGRWSVKVDVRVPGKEIVATRQHGEDLGEALREALTATGRLLQDHVRRCRREVKTPAGSRRGRVIAIFPRKGYGFLADADGREIYFHRRSVLASGFEKLGVGAPVRFAEEAGEEGPQASSVSLDGRPLRVRA